MWANYFLIRRRLGAKMLIEQTTLYSSLPWSSSGLLRGRAAVGYKIFREINTVAWPWWTIFSSENCWASFLDNLPSEHELRSDWAVNQLFLQFQKINPQEIHPRTWDLRLYRHAEWNGMIITREWKITEKQTFLWEINWSLFVFIYHSFRNTLG